MLLAHPGAGNTSSTDQVAVNLTAYTTGAILLALTASGLPHPVSRGPERDRSHLMAWPQVRWPKTPVE
jgi:hypothetical protein